MKNIKRLFCLLLVMAMLFTSGIVEVLAAEYNQSKKQTNREVHKEIPVADVSDLFVMEETQSEITETEPEETESEVTETAPVAAKPVVKVIQKSVSQDFTYSLLSDNTCRIDGYTGTVASVVIPDTIDGYPVTAIGANAFKNVETLESVVLPDSVTKIGSSAFQNCANLASITYPVSLKTVDHGFGAGVFSGCTALKSVIIPEGVTDLPDNIFYYAEELESVTLPSTLTTIGAQAFTGSGIQSIELPDGVTAIGNYAFQNCTALQSIDLGESLVTIGSYAFQNCAGLTSVELPDTVETIKTLAFQNCANLASITYPVSLKTVEDAFGAGIFSGCTALKTVTVPEGVTDLPDNIFYQAEALESVTLPSTLTTIGAQAFTGSGIRSIELPDGVTVIGNYAFQNCTALQSVDVGESLITIGSYAFKGCTGLTSVELPDTVKTIKTLAFQNCANLASITYPVSLKTVEDAFGAGIFSGCTALKTVTVPEGVTDLPDNIFYQAEALESVTLPSTLTTIGAQAFTGSGIQSIELPDGVTVIGNYAFQNCIALQSIDLGESLVTIGSYAFQNCTGLTFVELPDTVETIKTLAFQNCANLASITYPVSLKTVEDAYGAGIFSGCTALKSVIVPEGVTALPDNIFYQAEALESVTLPSTLTTIGAQAFTGSGIRSIELPDGVTVIGNYAFQNCTALQSVDVGESLITIGSFAFKGCTGLTFVELPDTVETIQTNAFGDCENLTDINYPVSLRVAVSGYHSGPFTGCTNLTEIVVPEGVETLAANVFSYAKSLQSVTLPSTLTVIGEEAFAGSGITSLELPNGVTTIGDYAFYQCAALQSIRFGENLTSIGYSTFTDCTGLTSIVLPSAVETIGSSAFSDCTALESFVMGDKITVVPYGLFYGCTNLKNVHLSRNAKEIRNSCFTNCTSLSQIYIPSSVKYIYSNAFNGVSGITFLCALNSYAAEYALDRQIPIIPTQMDNEEVNGPLNAENSYYIHNYDGLSAAGVMSMVVHYEMKEDSVAAPSAITIHIYDYAALQENTMTLDGVLCTDYEYDEQTGRLTVPVEAASGTLRFCLKPLRYEALTSYARLVLSDESVALIGSVNSLMPALNISARQETSLSTVAVNGLAIPETEVSLYVDGVLAKKVRTNKVGDYSAEVSLVTPVDGKEYLITAEAVDRDGNSVIAQTYVRYKEIAPELQEFVMIHGSSRVSLLDLQGTRPVITFRNSQFRFEIKFTNAEALDQVFVVSNRNNVKKHLKATWNEELGIFVAEGYFDPNNHSYVPGEITLQYTYKGKKISFHETYDFTSQEAYDALPQVWKDAKVEVQENTEDKLVMDVTTGYGEDQLSYQMSINSHRLPSHIREKDLINYGYQKIEDDYGYVQYVYEDLEGTSPFTGERAILSIVDFELGLVKDYAIDGFKDVFGKAIHNTVGFTHVTGLADTIFIIADTVETSMKIDELNAEYQALPNVTAAQKQAFAEKANQVSELAVCVGAMKCTLTVVSMVVAVMCPAALPAMGVVSTFYGLLMDVLLKEEIFSLYATAYGTGYKFRWAIDPSGYVYDELTGERLEGVTVHAYWIENTGEDPDFWEKKPGEDVYGVLWNSMDYSQMNPLFTDAEGRYAWDVPEGWWRVSYEKEGYESTWSQWLPVPPPQTEVNIGLMPIGGAILGDLTGDGFVDNQDVEYLLWYTLFPEEYSINQRADFNHDNSIDNLDVECLLWFTLFPEEFPLR